MNFVDKVFEYELSLIKSNEIKQFVFDVFDKLCPDYFWTCPCSTSGKYHPQVSLGEGGLVRHTKLAVWWGIELARAMQLEEHHDEMVATLLLHDLIKNGKDLGPNGRPLESGVTGTHGVTLTQKLLVNEKKLMEDEGLFSIPEWRVLVYGGIESHMGIWTTDPEYQPKAKPPGRRRRFVDLIHLADYCASRKVDEIYATLQEEKENEEDSSNSG